MNYTINKLMLAGFVAATMFICTGDLHAQESGTSSYVIRLTDQNIEKLVTDGELVSSFDNQFSGRLSSIVISHADVADVEAVTATDLSFTITDKGALLTVNDEFVDRVKAAPLRIPVSSAPFTIIRVVYLPRAASVSAQESAVPDVVAPQNRVYFVQLDGSQQMQGTIDGFDNFEIECKFGKVTIPMEHVAGIRFHADEDDNAVVVLTNGDSLTGTPTVAAISLMTSWGRADIEPEFMQSLTTSANATFSREASPDFGIRWMLRTALPVPSQPSAGFGG